MSGRGHLVLTTLLNRRDSYEHLQPSESAYWQGWADAFEPFLSHPNVRVRRIGERGKP